MKPVKEKVQKEIEIQAIQKKAYIQSLKGGASRKDSAKACGVGTTCIWNWIQKDKAFASEVSSALITRVEVVEDSLFKNATGHVRMKDGKVLKDEDGNVVMTQGQVIAQIFYLKNRGQGRWRDKQDIEFVAPKIVKRNTFIQAGEEPVIKEEEPEAMKKKEEDKE